MPKDKIFPRNLTARGLRGVQAVVGNPASTRLDSGVANCFPGLEFDVRTLETRFFPGLLFRYIVAPLNPEPYAIPNQQGVRLLYIDYLQDPMLPETSAEDWVQELLTQYGTNGAFATVVSAGRWYLEWVAQGDKRLEMTDPATGEYYDYEICWRTIRGLEPNEMVRIGLVRRDAPDPKPRQELAGRKRPYVNNAGLYDLAYRPGELTEAMCNPWTHDFRDCACHYWASNHPDVVVRDLPHPRGAAGASTVYVDWLSLGGQSATIPAFGTIAQNRQFQIDHYEINQKWEKLPFVLEGREIDREYIPGLLTEEQPYSNAEEMIRDLECNLAGMELALALQYLYALFSLHEPTDEEVTKIVHTGVWPNLAGDLAATRDFVLLVAVGEMAHLRIVNQMLWLLYKAGLGAPGRHYSPIVEPASTKRTLKAGRALRSLDPDTLDDFIDIERPSGAITRAYARCIATLRQPGYPPAVLELALRIDGEGLDHYERFLNVKRVLAGYGGRSGPFPYLRDVKPGRRDDPRCKPVLEIFELIRKNIREAYEFEADAKFDWAQEKIAEARRLMLKFREGADALAVQGIGVPFWDDAAPPGRKA